MRRVLILGAGGVLGRACATRLANDAQLWLTVRNPALIEPLRREFPTAEVSRVDVTGPGELPQLFAAIQSKWAALDTVVNAIGLGLLRPAARGDTSKVDELLSVNVRANATLCQLAHPLLKGGEAPNVVLFSSTMGLVGAPGMSMYCASKAAVAMFARSLALEWARERIRINAVAPGVVPSPLVDGMFKFLQPAQVDEVRARHPLGFGTPEDVGHAVAFLASPQARWITGVVLPVDGGYTAQ